MNEAEYLFTGILGYTKTDLLLNRHLKLPADKTILISDALKRRIEGEPVQYILGKAEFMGLEFRVTPDVLIPRQETEILLEKTIDVVTWLHGRKVTGLEILDVGTGSGNIAVSLAKFISGVKITAFDISQQALEIAAYNSHMNNVEQKIELTQSDLFESCREGVKYDIIVSNPPYVASEEIDLLQREIAHEPRMALDGGPDGLDFYRRIIAQAKKYIKDAGYLILEIGYGQAAAIKDIFDSAGKFEIIETVRDYSDIERVLVAQSR